MVVTDLNGDMVGPSGPVNSFLWGREDEEDEKMWGRER